MLPTPRVRRALLAATAGLALAVPALLIAPEPAWAESPNAAACDGLYHGDPPGSLALATDVAPGTVLHPGDSVEVTVTWGPADWPGPVLHKVLDCLTVNGTVDYPGSSQEKPTVNDGLYRYRFTVPPNTGGRLCDRARLSGRLVEGGPLVVQKSNTVCFRVASSGGTATPAVPAAVPAAAPGPGGDGPVLQPAMPVPGPGPEAAPPAAEVPAPTPTEISHVEISHVGLVPTLPQTGAGDILPLTRLGSMLVLLGAAARTTRRAVRPQP